MLPSSRLIRTDSRPRAALFSSPDGINWTERESGISETLYGVAFGNGTAIWASTDGTAWTINRLGPDLGLNGIDYANGVFLTGGSYGVIARFID
jgi:hypothetical protein